LLPLLLLCRCELSLGRCLDAEGGRSWAAAGRCADGGGSGGGTRVLPAAAAAEPAAAPYVRMLMSLKPMSCSVVSGPLDRSSRPLGFMGIAGCSACPCVATANVSVGCWV